MKKCYSSFRKKNILLLILSLCCLLHLKNNFFFDVQMTENKSEQTNKEVSKSFIISNGTRSSSSFNINGLKYLFHIKLTFLVQFFRTKVSQKFLKVI